MCVVIFLLFFNAGLAFREDLKAREAVEALKQKLQLSAKVLRDGQWSCIPARELVPGDVIRLRSGDWVPADARVAAGSCGVDQSALTGESVILDRPSGSLLFSASILKRGEVTCVVSAIGLHTFFGTFGGAIHVSSVHPPTSFLLLAGKTAKLVDESAPTTHIDTVVSTVTKGLVSIIIVALIAALIVLITSRHGTLLLLFVPSRDRLTCDARLPP